MPAKSAKSKIKRIPLRQRMENSAIGITKKIGSLESLIGHTVVFIAAFGLVLFGISITTVLLVMTTLLSFEAIYLSIFIQMSVNQTKEVLWEVEKDIEDIQEDIEDIQEDVEEIQEDVEEIQEDVEEIQDDVEARPTAA